MKKKLNILIIDDDQDDILLVKEYLSDNVKAKFQLTAAENLAEGIKLAKATNFDVILLDLGLNESKGLDTLHFFTEQNITAPIIVLTNNVDPEIGVKTISMGCEDFWVKRNISAEYLGDAILHAKERFLLKKAIDDKNKELIKSNERNQALLKAIPDLMFRISSEGVFLDYKAHIESDLYIPAEKIIGLKIEKALPPDVAELIIKHIRILNETGVIQVFEYSLPMPSGIEQFEARLALSGQNEIVSIVRNITERKLSYEKIKKYQDHLEELVKERTRESQILTQAIESSPTVKIITDNKGQITYVNKMFEVLTGYSKEEAVGKNPNLLKSGHHNSTFYKEMWKSLFEKGNWRNEIINKKKNGELIWQDVSISVIRDENKEITHFVSVQMDVTDRKKLQEDLEQKSVAVEKARQAAISLMQDSNRQKEKTQKALDELKSSQKELRKLSVAINQSPISIIITDNEGIIEYANPYFTEISGYSFDEVKGKKPNILKSNTHAHNFYKEMWDTINSGDTWWGEIHNKKKNGELFWESATISPVFSDDEQITHYIAIKEDITIKKTEELRATQNRKRLLGQQSALNNIAQGNIFINPNFIGAIQELTMQVAVGLDVERVGVWLFTNVQKEKLSLIDLYQKNQELHSSDNFLERKNYPHFFESIQIQKIISAPDARNDVRTKELTKDFFVPLDIYSLLNASIMVDGDVLGFVHCASPGEKNEWSIDEENFIRSISDFIALIISNNNRRKTQETLEKFTDLQQLVAGLASKFIYIPIQKLDEEIEHSLMLLVKNMQMDGAFITYINNETPAKFVVKQRWLGESLQLFENQFINFDPNNHAFEKEKETNDYSLFFYSKWESNKAKREKDFMYKIGVRSGISLSIKDNYGEIIGNLCFLSTLPKILLSNSEISLLSSLTTVLENAFLRKKREEELIRAKVKAEEATLSKSVFLANMSHEIRTPLNAVLGFSEILSRMIKEPTQVDFLNSIRSSGKTLLSLINDILDLSKIEAGKLSIQENEVNLAAIFSEIQNTFIQKTANKGVDFTLSIPADFPKYVILDELRIKQVILNLVSNAVKFTEKGYVNLSLKLKRLGKESVDFELVVKDTGIGVSKGFKKRIFEAFEQQDGQDSRKYGGTGLGLAITHKIITMLGANISLKSEINKGSRFLIKFTDVALADESTLKISKESRLNPERVIFSSPHILVVDDIEENRKLIKGFLLPYAVHLSEAQDGLEAINLMKTNPPDFVFMDLRMPVMDGEEALKVIRANPETEKIPVVALTASAFRTKEKEIECSGFDGYVRKPASLQDIVEIMAKFLPHELKDEKESEKPDSSSITINLSTELYSEIEENVLPLALELHKIRPKKKVIFLAETIIEIGKKYKNEAVENYGQELLRANTNFNVEKERELIMKMEKVFQKA